MIRKGVEPGEGGLGGGLLPEALITGSHGQCPRGDALWFHDQTSKALLI